MSRPTIRSATKIHPGKSTPAVVNFVNVSSVIAQLVEPKKKSRGDSVLGASHDFRIVGSAAIWSATTKETSATVGSLTKVQNTSPPTDTAPHTASNAPSFHTPLGLWNEATTTAHGTSPSINVMSAASPTCCCTSTQNAKMPSTPHSDHVTRFGAVSPRKVSPM